MADDKNAEGTAAKETDDKVLEDLEVDEETDVRGGRRAGRRLSPDQ